MRTAIRFIAASVLVLVGAGVISNFLITPALAGPDGLGAYASVPVWSMLSAVLWTGGWIFGVLLAWLAVRSLLELIDRRVSGPDARGVFASAVVVGTIAVVSGTFLIPHAATALAFSRVNESSSVSPIPPALGNVAVVALLLTALLALLGALMARRPEEREIPSSEELASDSQMPK